MPGIDARSGASLSIQSCPLLAFSETSRCVSLPGRKQVAARSIFLGRFLRRYLQRFCGCDTLSGGPWRVGIVVVQTFKLSGALLF